MNLCYLLLFFSRSVMSKSLRPCGLQHTRPLCPSPSPRACPNSCPLIWWCYPTISSSITPFSFCLQSFPASRSFLMSQFFASGGQSIGASASVSVLPMNTQDWSHLGWTGWISLLSKGLSRVFSNTETIYLRLGLESMFWDSNSAKTHSTRIQDLMKPRFLMSHHRKNSERDKVIIKKWI